MKIAILSDIHGNINALNVVLSDMKSLDVSEIVFLGDLVINGPAPLEVFQELRKLEIICWIKGNTDAWFEEIDDNWSPATKQEEELYQNYIYARNHLSRESINFLISQPEKCSFEIGGISILAVHGSPRSISEGIGENISYEELNAIFSSVEESIVVCGHTHIPCIKEIENKVIFNVGSIGMSLDRDNRASYGLIKIENGTPKCLIRRVSYPINESLKDAKIKNLPNLKKYEKILKEAKLPSRVL
ncbi:MAG: metallophosphoesterase family protein [Promethearchaeota archaeon]